MWHTSLTQCALLKWNCVQFSHSVVSDPLQPYGLQDSRPACPLPTPRIYSNSCPLSRWCHTTTSSSVIPFSSRLQSFPESVQFNPVARLCPTLCNPMNRSTPGLLVHHQLPEFNPTHVHLVDDAIQLSHPLSSRSPPALNLLQHRVFFNESALCIRWPKYWSFSFIIISSNEHPGLISFRMDWLDLLADQGTLKSLLQHRSSKASILWLSAFFTV